MRFSLRTLLIVMLIAALGVIGWTKWQAYQHWQQIQAEKAERQRKYAEAVALLEAIQKAQQELYVGRPKNNVTQERLKAILEGLDEESKTTEPEITVDQSELPVHED